MRGQSSMQVTTRTRHEQGQCKDVIIPARTHAWMRSCINMFIHHSNPGIRTKENADRADLLQHARWIIHVTVAIKQSIQWRSWTVLTRYVSFGTSAPAYAFEGLNITPYTHSVLSIICFSLWIIPRIFYIGIKAGGWGSLLITWLQVFSTSAYKNIARNIFPSCRCKGLLLKVEYWCATHISRMRSDLTLTILIIIWISITLLFQFIWDFIYSAIIHMCLMSVMTPMEFSRAEYSALFRRNCQNLRIVSVVDTRI
jgi:hypothetical protein